MVIQILWNECRQPLVALYRYGRSAVEGDKDTLSLWRPCASAWVSRLKEVIDTTIELHEAGFSKLEEQPHWEAQSPTNNSDSAWFNADQPAAGEAQQGSWTEALCHLRAHVICVAMASALCYLNYEMMQHILELKEEKLDLHTLATLLDRVQQDIECESPDTSPLGLAQPSPNSSVSPRSPKNKTVKYPLKEQILAQMGLYVCHALRKLLLRIIGEGIHATSLKTLQVLGCVDAWQHGYETVATCSTRGVNIVPDADRVEHAFLHDYDGGLCSLGGSSLWLYMRKHSDVQDLISYAKHSSWAQIKTRWNTGARFFVLQAGCLGTFEVGEADANYSDQSAWSPALKHYTVADGGNEEGLFKITLSPLGHKKAFETYNMYCDTYEEQQTWLRKLERHCCDAEKAARLERVRSSVEGIVGKR